MRYRLNSDNDRNTTVVCDRGSPAPWAAVTDGPALRRTSQLAWQLAELGKLPPDAAPTDENFESWREYWKQAGIFTLADRFGDDGSKSGEFEAFIGKLDAGLRSSIKSELGTRSQPQIGAAFASRYQITPEVEELYQSIMESFGQVATQASDSHVACHDHGTGFRPGLP
ncbi:MAG: hypothetical protein ACRDT4_07360 [Micromonosporaceae bacterium]